MILPAHCWMYIWRKENQKPKKQIPMFMALPLTTGETGTQSKDKDHLWVSGWRQSGVTTEAL